MPRLSCIRVPFLCLVIGLICAGTLTHAPRPAAAAGSDCSVLSFNAAPTYFAGKTPNFVTSGDFNGDGILDLAVANSSFDDNEHIGISILRGDGAGNFTVTALLKIKTWLSSEPGFIAVGDFNNDNRPDLAVSAVSYGEVSIFLNAGDGAFAAPAIFDAGSKPKHLLIRDLNGDGNADLVAADLEDNFNPIAILFGDGKGGFAPKKKISFYQTPGAMDFGDFNNDGKIDIITVPTQGAAFATAIILLGDGAGNFAAQPPVEAGGAQVKVADFNNDGNADIVTDGTWLTVRFGNGKGGFSSKVEFEGFFASSLSVGDYNGDGKADFSFTGANSNHVGVMLGNGAGGFTTKIFAAGAQPVSLVTGDFNRDGKADLSVANSRSNDASILIGKGNGDFYASPNYRADLERNSMASGFTNINPIAAADFNKDGVSDLAVVNANTRYVTIHINDGQGGFKTPVRYFGGSAARSVVAADFNGDGNVDITVSHNADGISSFTTLFGKGDGTFINADFGWSYNVDPVPLYLQAGDFNNDGRPDLALMTGTKISIALNTGKGFSSAGSFGGGDAPTSISLGDLNRDGNLDLAVTSTGNQPGRTFLIVAFGDGAGGISSTKTVTVGEFLYTAAIYDMNGDTLPDIVASGAFVNSGDAISVLLGTGAGNFAAPKNFPTDPLYRVPYAVAAGDFNGDGRPDVAYTSLDGSVGIMLGDGTGNLGTSFNYGAGANPRSLVAGNFNNDGKSDVVTANYTSSDVTALMTTPCTRPAPSPTPQPTPTPVPTPVGNYVEFSSSSYSFNEGTINTAQGFGALNVTVVRGDNRFPATVQITTSDSSGGNECSQVTGFASQRCDYTPVGGTLRFAAGESTKVIQIPIVNDGYQEGNETFRIKLQGLGGVVTGTKNNEATVTISDDAADATPTTGANNPYLSNEFFVRMNYLDFLVREPDQGGFSDWTGVLNNCGSQKGFLGAPLDCDRAHVSHGFFGSPEFTDTGFLIYRIYEVGMGRLPRYAEFTPDMAGIGGFGVSDEIKQQNILGFLQQFTLNRPEFTNRFGDAMQPSQAATLIQKFEQAAGVALPSTATTNPGQPTQYGRQELINKRASGEFTVGQTLKAFVEQQLVYDRFFPRGQVTMLYFAYLKRDPDLNDPNLAGWNEWVFVFTNGGAQRGRPDILPRDIHHLIFGFIYSEEYRKRFGQP